MLESPRRPSIPGHLSSDEEYSPELEWEGREALEEERCDLVDIWDELNFVERDTSRPVWMWRDLPDPDNIR